MTKIEFSDWLQKELDQRGWAGNKLAMVSGLDASIINRALNRERLPNPVSLTAIANALGYSPSEVFEEAGLLPKSKKSDQLKERILYLAEQLPEDEYQDLLRYIEMRIDIARERGKLPPYAPPKNQPSPG